MPSGFREMGGTAGADPEGRRGLSSPGPAGCTLQGQVEAQAVPHLAVTGGIGHSFTESGWEKGRCHVGS